MRPFSPEIHERSRTSVGKKHFKPFLQETATAINDLLPVILEDRLQLLGEKSPEIPPLMRLFIDSCVGGKRLRGTLVKLGFQLIDPTDNPEILKPAIAYEVFQTAILAHDDVIDRSDVRRNRPTIHKALGNNHYGMSQAISLGDTGFFLALDILVNSNFPQERKNRAIHSFTQTMLQTCVGQVLDVRLSHEETQVTEPDILAAFELKTANYTIVGPLQLGAILAGADDTFLTFVHQFGLNLGMAFQIQDDVLGVFGESSRLGKPITSDIQEGKNTLLISHARANSTPTQQSILDSIYGVRGITQTDVERIRQVFVESGALTTTQEKAEFYLNNAREMIPQISSTPQTTILLQQLADFVVKREL
jgi:geranylgeranyl diphosphate synthase, type I